MTSSGVRCSNWQRKGIATLWLILLMPVILVLLCLVIDVGKLWLERSALENTLEIGALSAVKEWGDLGPSLATIPDANNVGISFVGANTICADAAVALPDNFVYGRVEATGMMNIFHINDYSGCGGGTVFIEIDKPNAGVGNPNDSSPVQSSQIRVEYREGPPNVYIDTITFTIPQVVVQQDSQRPYFDATKDPAVSQIVGESLGLMVQDNSSGNWWCSQPPPSYPPMGFAHDDAGDICFEVDDPIDPPYGTDRVRTLVMRFRPNTFTADLNPLTPFEFFHFGVSTAQFNPPAFPPGTQNDGDSWGNADYPIEVNVTFVNANTNVAQTVSGEFVDTGGNDGISQFFTQGAFGSRPAVHSLAQYSIPSLCGILGPFTVSGRTTAVYDCSTGRVELVRIDEFRENGSPVPPPPFPPLLPP